MKDDRIVETDVLVVGGGGAGLRAAIGARERGASAVLVSKGPLARCGATPMAGADLTVDGRSLHDMGFRGEPKDTKNTWFRDIVHQGYFLNNQRLVEVYVDQAPARVMELLDWGIKVDSSEERAIYTTGREIADALRRRAEAVGVTMLADTTVVDLLARDGRVVGAVGLDVRTGSLITFKAKAVVLATGGWHKAYAPNCGPKEMAGEGIGMAYRAGAEVGNMEFVTFACPILVWPPRWAGTLFAYILHIYFDGRLANSDGDDILTRYDPDVVRVGTSTEWNKSFLSFALGMEIAQGRGSPHGGVYYRPEDGQKFYEQVNEKLPRWKYKGVDFSDLGKVFRDGGPVEVGPVAEYFEGGVTINERCETTVPGLYAAGECTMSLFGANRVSAATTEMVVQGAIAGWAAGEYARGADWPGLDDGQLQALQGSILAPLSRKDGDSPIPLRRRMQRLAQSNLGPVRGEAGLKEMLQFLEGLRKSELQRLGTSSSVRAYNKEWLEAIELQNMAQVLELSALSALKRTESRGVHYRAEYPHADNDGWLREIVCTRQRNEPVLATRPVTVTTFEPPTGKPRFLDMMREMMLAHSDVGGHH